MLHGNYACTGVRNANEPHGITYLGLPLASYLGHMGGGKSGLVSTVWPLFPPPTWPGYEARLPQNVCVTRVSVGHCIPNA